MAIVLPSLFPCFHGGTGTLPSDDMQHSPVHDDVGALSLRLSRSAREAFFCPASTMSRVRSSRIAAVARHGTLALLLLFSALSAATEVPLVQEGGVFTVPVRINGVITLKFIVDSGAADVQIPADVAMTLVRAETITQQDFLPGQTYRLADGSSLKSPRFIIRRLEIADHVVENVAASLGSAEGALLLGQSLLTRLPAWSVDNRRHVLILADADTPTLPPAAETPAPPRTVAPELTPRKAVASIDVSPPASSSSAWHSDWGNDIRATALTLPCAVTDFQRQGYRHALTVDIPASRVGNAMEAWAIGQGRAVTVQGCWFQKSDGRVHAKMRRKKDGKVWEQDFNFQDGSWTANGQGAPVASPTARTGSVYFAAETPPTDADSPPEAPLCYRFNVASLEEQQARLESKYGAALAGVEMVGTGAARMLKAERTGEQGETIRYRYFE